MKILVINSGSSSLKFQVIDTDTEEVLAKGQCERIGIDGVFNYKTARGPALKEKYPMKSHKEAVDRILKTLVDPEMGVIGDYGEIDVVGHRLVHGGEKFTGSVVITDEVLDVMRACNDLAPLHNPANIVGVEACRELMPDTLMVGVLTRRLTRPWSRRHFSTAFPTGFTRSTRSAAMGFTGSATSMCPGGPRSLWGRGRTG